MEMQIKLLEQKTCLHQVIMKINYHYTKLVNIIRIPSLIIVKPPDGVHNGIDSIIQRSPHKQHQAQDNTIK